MNGFLAGWFIFVGLIFLGDSIEIAAETYANRSCTAAPTEGETK
jgi:hypothetical protein